METNFFQQVSALNIKGNLNITINTTESIMVVSVLLGSEQCGDPAKNLLSPLILKGVADELDKGFFEGIGTPLQSTSELLINMEAFLKQKEKAKMQSALEKEKADKDRKEKEARDKKYKEAMQKSDELEKEGRYKDAWMKVPDPAQYPEYIETIQKRRSFLAAKFSPGLFDEPVQTAIEEPQEAHNEEDFYQDEKDEFTDEQNEWSEDNEDTED